MRPNATPAPEKNKLCQTKAKGIQLLHVLPGVLTYRAGGGAVTRSSDFGKEKSLAADCFLAVELGTAHNLESSDSSSRNASWAISFMDS